jgi:tRNA A37 N6-isopentenylltransferase MiaA
MKVTYKGFDIIAEREKCMAGYDLLYYRILSPDEEFIVDSFEDSAETVREKIKQLKETVDDYLENSEYYKDELDILCEQQEG